MIRGKSVEINLLDRKHGRRANKLENPDPLWL